MRLQEALDSAMTPEASPAASEAISYSEVWGAMGEAEKMDSRRIWGRESRFQEHGEGCSCSGGDT